MLLRNLVLVSILGKPYYFLLILYTHSGNLISVPKPAAQYRDGCVQGLGFGDYSAYGFGEGRVRLLSCSRRFDLQVFLLRKPLLDEGAFKGVRILRR